MSGPPDMLVICDLCLLPAIHISVFQSILKLIYKIIISHWNQYISRSEDKEYFSKIANDFLMKFLDLIVLIKY